MGWKKIVKTHYCTCIRAPKSGFQMRKTHKTTIKCTHNLVTISKLKVATYANGKIYTPQKQIIGCAVSVLQNHNFPRDKSGKFN